MVDTTFDGAHIVITGDIDSDDDIDLLATARVANDIAWYENDGNESFTKHIITDNYGWPTFICPCDIDDDSNVDIVSAGYTANDVSWWQNDGSENFTKQTISSTFSGAIPVTAVDLDGDTDFDVIGAAYDLNDVTWWESDAIGVEEGSTGWVPGDRTSASIVTSVQQLGFDHDGLYEIFDVSGRKTNHAEMAPGTYFIKARDATMYKVVLVR